VKRRVAVLGILILVAGLVTVWLTPAKGPGCNVHYRHDKKLLVNGHQLYAEIASSDQQKATGLSGRACIPEGQAMLFMFDRPGYYPFWMKGMKFPIDIVWLSPAKTVVTVYQNVTPETYPKSFTNSQPAEYVVEVGVGQAQKLGILTGTAVSF
jgi:uncharacterized membrane protein (UPF0127 family)